MKLKAYFMNLQKNTMHNLLWDNVKLNENVFELLAADFMSITVWDTVKQTVNYLKHISNGNIC